MCVESNDEPEGEAWECTSTHLLKLPRVSTNCEFDIGTCYATLPVFPPKRGRGHCTPLFTLFTVHRMVVCMCQSIKSASRCSIPPLLFNRGENTDCCNLYRMNFKLHQNPSIHTPFLILRAVFLSRADSENRRTGCSLPWFHSCLSQTGALEHYCILIITITNLLR